MSAVARFAELASPDVDGRLDGATLVWPLGAVEQHGPHLPLNVDLLLAEQIADALAVRLGAVVLPAVSIGARSLPQSGGGPAFAGTVHVAGGTLVDYLRESLTSLLRVPFARLVVVNGHFENEPFLFEALDQVRGHGGLDGRTVLAFSWWSLVEDGWLDERGHATVGWHAEHAGLTETALMLHLRPDLVGERRPAHDSPPRPGVYVHPSRPDRISDLGALSSSVDASPELGKALFEHLVDRAVDVIDDPEPVTDRRAEDRRT